MAHHLVFEVVLKILQGQPPGVDHWVVFLGDEGVHLKGVLLVMKVDQMDLE